VKSAYNEIFCNGSFSELQLIFEINFFPIIFPLR
jgi:hypothetical protein